MTAILGEVKDPIIDGDVMSTHSHSHVSHGCAVSCCLKVWLAQNFPEMSVCLYSCCDHRFCALCVFSPVCVDPNVVTVIIPFALSMTAWGDIVWLFRIIMESIELSRNNSQTIE